MISQENIDLVINALVKIILDAEQSSEVRCKAMEAVTKLILQLEYKD